MSSKLLKPRPRYGDFSIFINMAVSAILDLYCVCWDHPRKAFGGFYHCANVASLFTWPWRDKPRHLYHCAKFGWYRRRSLDNMRVFWLREFGLKNISRSKNVFYCFEPLSGEPLEQNPKRHILARVRVVWAIMRENPSTGVTCRWEIKNGV